VVVQSHGRGTALEGRGQDQIFSVRCIPCGHSLSANKEQSAEVPTVLPLKFKASSPQKLNIKTELLNLILTRLTGPVNSVLLNRWDAFTWWGSKIERVRRLVSKKIASIINIISKCTQGNEVALLVEALCYKPKGRGFDSR
jgi:hypothetical protein